MDSVASCILTARVDTAHLATLGTTVRYHYSLDAVGWQFRAQHKLAADLATTLWAGALGATKVHKIGLASWHTAVHETSLHTVIVLVAFTGTALLNTGGAAGSWLQGFLNAVLQYWTLHACAVLPRDSHAWA